MADLSAGSAHTALSRDPDNGRRFVERYSDRLLFGRDDFGGRNLQYLLGLGVSNAALNAVLGLNALRLVP